MFTAEPDPVNTPNPDEVALRWLIGKFRTGQWAKLAEAVKVIDSYAGGHGRIILIMQDGFVQDHPKAEISIK